MSLGRIKFTVMGDKWTAVVWEAEDYNKHFGSDSEAITMGQAKAIHFNKDELTLNTIRHELVHVYSEYLYINSANLSKDQTEEVYAELFAFRGEEMNVLAKKLLKELRKYD